MAYEIHEIFYAFGPQLNTFMSNVIWLKYFRRKLLQFAYLPTPGRPGDFMKNLETPGKTGRVGRYEFE